LCNSYHPQSCEFIHLSSKQSQYFFDGFQYSPSENQEIKFEKNELYLVNSYVPSIIIRNTTVITPIPLFEGRLLRSDSGSEFMYNVTKISLFMCLVLFVFVDLVFARHCWWRRGGNKSSEAAQIDSNRHRLDFTPKHGTTQV
jgi:hypothetical protein